MRNRRWLSISAIPATFALAMAVGGCDSFETTCEGAACDGPQTPESETPSADNTVPGASAGGGGGSASGGGAGAGGGSAGGPVDEEPGNIDEEPVIDPGNPPIEVPSDEFVEVPTDEFENPVDPGTQPDPADPVDEEQVADPVETPEQQEWITLEQLDAVELQRIDEIRAAIFGGLEVGRSQYLESISLLLHKNKIVNDYESVLIDGWQTLQTGFSTCPFAEFYDNANVATVDCGYLAELAKVEAYSTLGTVLDTTALPSIVSAANAPEALFWQEQGAISGIEEKRVVVTADLLVQGYCNQVPKPVESSAAKGYVLGRQLMIDKMNAWLASNGHKADYPKMTQKVQVCALNASVLNPAKKAAVNGINDVLADEPLCPGYQAPTMAGQLQFAQAQLDYQKSIKQGIEDEFALAAVKIFQVVPCNVSDPLVVDLDGDGIELLNIADGVDFDLWSTGKPQAVAWIAPREAFLGLDRNGDGIITDGSELFGDVRGEAGDGFRDLAILDELANGGNGDGVIDQDDAAFHSLVLWRDADSDGQCTSRELVSLTQAGILQLPTRGHAVSLRSGGNAIGEIALGAGINGPVLVGDAYLHSAPHARLAMQLRR